MSEILKIGVAGLGTVGASVVKLVHQNADLLHQRTGKTLQVTAVSSQNRTKDRGLGNLLDGVTWYDNATDMANDSHVYVVVELIGGEHGIALELCQKALANEKHVVTANKAMVAHHGHGLATLAEQHNRAFVFEAAVAGGIPILKTLREGLSANRITNIMGIMNGTSNYILTTMLETGETFDAILQQATELGYAEADPTYDVDGIDTAHKNVILASMAFHSQVSFSNDLYIEGIRHIEPVDIYYAHELGFKIKLLAVASVENGALRQYVYPALVPLEHPLAGIDGVENAVFIQADAVGSIMLRGPGAGGMATASSVVADIADIASGRISPSFSVPTAKQSSLAHHDITQHYGAYYIRLEAKDKSGVLADITDILGQENVSVDRILQNTVNEEKAVDNSENAQIVVTTHATSEIKMRKVVEKIKKVANVVRKPQLLRIQML